MYAKNQLFQTAAVNLFETIEESRRVEPLLPCQLEREEAQVAPFDCHVQVTFAVRADRPGRQCVPGRAFLRAVNLERKARPVGLHQFRPSSRIGRKPAYEIINPLQRLLPVDAAGLLEYLWGGTQLTLRNAIRRLFDGLHLAGENEVDRLQHQSGTEMHQGVAGASGG